MVRARRLRHFPRVLALLEAVGRAAPAALSFQHSVRLRLGLQAAVSSDRAEPSQRPLRQQDGRHLPFVLWASPDGRHRHSSCWPLGLSRWLPSFPSCSGLFKMATIFCPLNFTRCLPPFPSCFGLFKMAATLGLTHWAFQDGRPSFPSCFGLFKMAATVGLTHWAFQVYGRQPSHHALGLSRWLPSFPSWFGLFKMAAPLPIMLWAFQDGHHGWVDPLGFSRWPPAFPSCFELHKMAAALPIKPHGRHGVPSPPPYRMAAILSHWPPSCPTPPPPPIDPPQPPIPPQ